MKNIKDLVELLEAAKHTRMPYAATYLRDFGMSEAVIIMAEAIQSAIVKKGSLTDTCERVGGAIRRAMNLPLDGEMNFRGGLWIFEVFVSSGLVDIIAVRKNKDVHTTYYIKVLDWVSLLEIWDQLKPEYSVWIQPMLEVPEDWSW